LGQNKPVFAVGAKKPGFWGGYQELSVGGEKETRFLGFWVSSVGRKKPGFFCGYHELFVGTKKETRFLGLSGVDIRSYLWVAKKKPGFSRSPLINLFKKSLANELIDFDIHPTIALLKHNYEANE
jgi:hypothetical protein